MKTDPTIDEALAAGEDATGLGTVRDTVRFMLEKFCDKTELYFDLDGKRVNVEIAITKVAK